MLQSISKTSSESCVYTFSQLMSKEKECGTHLNGDRGLEVMYTASAHILLARLCCKASP